MNRDQLEEAAEQRWFEVMLDEVRGERRGVTAAPPRAVPWLAAAILLLGLAAVVGVFVSTRTGNSQAAPQEPRPLPAPVPVRGRAALEALDARTENVSLQFDPAEGLPSLDHLPNLRALSLETDQGLRPASPMPSLQPLTACPRLEQVTIGRFGGSCDAAALRPLMALPNLRSLTLVGRDKCLTVDVVEVLSKLALRSLSLQDAELHPAGFAALDGLPLLQRIELRHCGGLGKCDLRVLCRLRELRGLSLRDQAFPEVLRFAEHLTTSQPVTIELLPVRSDKLEPMLDPRWVSGLAKALRQLTVLDLSGSRIDDHVLAALPASLRELRIVDALGFGERGVAAVLALPNLESLAVGDTRPGPVGGAAQSTPPWLPLIGCKKLQKLELWPLTEGVVAALAACSELRELHLDPGLWLRFHLVGEPREADLPDLSPLARLPRLEVVKLTGPAPVLRDALRRAVRPGVRIEP